MELIAKFESWQEKKVRVDELPMKFLHKIFIERGKRKLLTALQAKKRLCSLHTLFTRSFQGAKDTFCYELYSYSETFSLINVRHL